MTRSSHGGSRGSEGRKQGCSPGLRETLTLLRSHCPTAAPKACAIPPGAEILWESRTCTLWLSKSHTSPSEPTNSRLTKAFSRWRRRRPCRAVLVPPRLVLVRRDQPAAGRSGAASDRRQGQTHGAGGLPGCRSALEMATEGEPARLHTSHELTPKKEKKPNWFILIVWTGAVIRCKMHSGAFLPCSIP